MKVLMAAGGSGGHVLPALYTAKELKHKGCDVTFVGTEGLMADKIRNEGFDLFFIGAKGFSFHSIFSFISSTINTIKALGQSFSFLRKIKPDVVAGFGGYGSFPAVLSAWFFRCPVLIHEQNVIPGKANRLLSKIAKKIAISFKESKIYFDDKKTVLTGCPCHTKLQSSSTEDMFKKFNLYPDKFTILVLGGSQGSHRINQDVMEAASLLKDKLGFQIIHVTGRQDHDTVKEKYQNLGVTSCVFGFLNEMNEAYKIADLVISRAGAVTVSEIALFELPAILIPYPFAGEHQKENSKILSTLGVAKMIEEKDLSPQKLKEEIIQSAKYRVSKDMIKNRLKGIVFTNAAHRVAQEILSLKK